MSGGATPKILSESDELYSRVEELALSAGKALNINFATIDIIRTKDDNLYVLEINSGVCATIFVDLVDNGYDIIKKIYSKALDELFK